MLGKGPDFLAVRWLVARSDSREPVTVSPPSASTLRNPFIVGYASLTLLTYSLVASSGTAAYLASLLNLDGQKKGPRWIPGALSDSKPRLHRASPPSESARLPTLARTATLTSRSISFPMTRSPTLFGIYPPGARANQRCRGKEEPG